MKTRLFPRSNRPLSTRRWFVSALAALAAIGFLGAVWVRADFSAPPAGASPAELMAWMNEQIQANSQAVTQAASAATASILSDPSACVPSTIYTGGCASCGCSPCTCQEPAETPCGCAPCMPAPCNPFFGLVGKSIVVHLDGNVTVWGTLVRECGGFLILSNQAQTFTVSIRKILYTENE